MSEAAQIGGAFARALEADRDRFNALFAQARRATPQLDGAAFAEHLRTTVAPIVAEVDRAAPDKVGEVVEALYDLSLELVGKELLGPKGRYPLLADGWRRLLGGLPKHLAAAPRPFAGSVTNALYNLAQTPGARPGEWLVAVLQLGPRCPDVPTLLEAGKVLAWRAGLAHYHDGALLACANLKPDLAAAALGLPADGRPLEPVLTRLREDPWLSPATALRPAKEKALRLVARVGAFRGFGGVFLRPPTVTVAEGGLLVGDGESCWALAADRFGATLHRAGDSLPKQESGGGFRLGAEGRVTTQGRSNTFPELAGSTSFAATPTTLAVTVPLSHAVFLVALTEEAP